jgi:hypothetical protein
MTTTRQVPEDLWGYQADSELAQPPVVLANHVVMADTTGRLFLIQKDRRALADLFVSPEPLTASIGQSGDDIYVAAQDHNIYGFEVIGGRLTLRWRYTTANLVLQKPMVVGDDLYVVPEARGLICLDRFTGALRWRYPPGQQFVAASKRLVFVADRQGQTHVVERQRGQPVGTLNTRDFAIRVPNDVSDRLILANHDGLVVCLHDRAKGHEQPVYHNAPEVKPAAKPPEPQPAPDEKPKEPMN